jgi:hypothetical protein
MQDVGEMILYSGLYVSSAVGIPLELLQNPGDFSYIPAAASVTGFPKAMKPVTTAFAVVNSLAYWIRV